jgi:beta-N-acetylhexosaminidase
MVSSATYPRIDGDSPACFSATVITTMLRQRLGFHGIVLSDSLGAAAVASVRPAQRAVRFLLAGGTMIVDSDGAQMVPMAKAILARSKSDPTFAKVVARAVMLVLTRKARAGLIG